MRIGILGAGNIGSTLGKKWAASGHRVMFGVRAPDSDEVQQLVQTLGGQAHAGSVSEAVAFGDVVVIAVPAAAVQQVVHEGRDWVGKLVIDATNRFNPPVPSLSEELAGWAEGALIVKAFNSAGFEVLENPEFEGQQADTFICGDDANSKEIVTKLAQELGMGVIDAGELSSAPMLDSLCKLWIELSKTIGRDHAFKMLTR
ncbi:MAG: NAD(P)-binding domain-containing protein [Chloroflexia bacterium]